MKFFFRGMECLSDKTQHHILGCSPDTKNKCSLLHDYRCHLETAMSMREPCLRSIHCSFGGNPDTELPSVSLKQTRQTGFFIIVVIRDSIFQTYLQPPLLRSVSSRKELVQDGVRLQSVHERRDPWHCELPSVSAKQRRYSLFLLMLWCASIFH